MNTKLAAIFNLTALVLVIAAPVAGWHTHAGQLGSFIHTHSHNTSSHHHKNHTGHNPSSENNPGQLFNLAEKSTSVRLDQGELVQFAFNKVIIVSLAFTSTKLELEATPALKPTRYAITRPRSPPLA